MIRFRSHIISIVLSLLFSAGALESLAQDKLETTQTNTEGFFTLGKVNDSWCFIKPEGKPLFSVGLNHIDPATLRYPENIHIWEKEIQREYY